MTEQELQAIEERWAKAYDGDDRQAVRKAMKDIAALLAEVRRLKIENKLLDHRRRFSYREQSKRYLSILRLKREVRRLNELLDMRCTNCHLRKESEVANK